MAVTPDQCRPSHKHAAPLLLRFPTSACDSHEKLTHLYEQYKTGSRCNSYLHRAANDGKKRKEGVPQAIAAMKAVGGRIEYVSKHDLNQVVENRPHQVYTSSLMEILSTREPLTKQCHLLLPALVVA